MNAPLWIVVADLVVLVSSSVIAVALFRRLRRNLRAPRIVGYEK